ncbi:MAG: hypothetical protein ACI97P_001062, partial [Arcticibacterium sp.]
MSVILIVVIYLLGGNAAFSSPLSLKNNPSKNPPP